MVKFSHHVGVVDLQEQQSRSRLKLSPFLLVVHVLKPLKDLSLAQYDHRAEAISLISYENVNKP